MEAWMQYDQMLSEVFQCPGAYSFRDGSHGMRWLYDESDEALGRLSLPQLSDEAVSVDAFFAKWKGRYLALHAVIEAQGLTDFLDKELSRAARVLRHLQALQERLRLLLDAASL